MSRQRELLTKQELSNRLSSELQEVEDAEGSEIRVQYLLGEPDEDGCNWSDSIVLRLGPKATKEGLAPSVARIVAQARMKYNIKD